MTSDQYWIAFAVLLGALVAFMFAAIAYAQPTGSNTPGGFVLPAVTFANLPAKTTGTLAYISDGASGNCADGTCTTFGTNVTGGGGALKLKIWYNGTNWTLTGK